MLEQYYCLIRKVWVAGTPEELVRQRLISRMINELGYPISSLALERGLKQMPHLKLTDQKVPARRADIICFGPNIHPQYPLYPLLLIECKAVALTSKVVNQTVGYNHFLKAYFIAMANQHETRTGWYDPSNQGYAFIDHLPSYQELISSLERKGRKE